MTPFIAYFITTTVYSLFSPLEEEGSRFATLGEFFKLVVFYALQIYFLTLTPFFNGWTIPNAIWLGITAVITISYPIVLIKESLLKVNDETTQIIQRISNSLFTTLLFGWGGAFN